MPTTALLRSELRGEPRAELPGGLPGELLVSRLHVDLLRVSTAACRSC